MKKNKHLAVIISHSRKFIFVKTNKTAGSSFEGLLCHYLSDHDLITAIRLPEEEQYITNALHGKNIRFLNGPESTFKRSIKSKFFQHVSLDVAHTSFPETIKYFSFGLIRNPFSRHMSSFRWRQSQNIQLLIKNCKSISEAEQRLQIKFLNFIRHDRGMLSNRGRNLLQGTRPDGTTWSVDCVYKLEDLKHLENDFKSRGIVSNLDTSAMPRFKSENFKIPSEINLWTEESINAVRAASTWEIEQMGYEDTPQIQSSKG